ncbi:MAG: hypothetical protein ABSH38_09800 [Verrucomicrobiota bacterium]
MYQIASQISGLAKTPNGMSRKAGCANSRTPTIKHNRATVITIKPRFAIMTAAGFLKAKTYAEQTLTIAVSHNSKLHMLDTVRNLGDWLTTGAKNILMVAVSP